MTFGVHVAESVFGLLVCVCLSVFSAEACVLSGDEALLFENGEVLFFVEFVLSSA